VCAKGRVVQAHRSEPRAFPLWRPVSDERRRKISHRNRKRKRHHYHLNEKEKRGCARVSLRRHKQNVTKQSVTTKHGKHRVSCVISARRETDAGERIPSSPQTAVLHSEAKRRNKQEPRHLGARSHSGNARGGCRGCTHGRQTKAVPETNY
jgi:hypothetical protein